MAEALAFSTLCIEGIVFGFEVRMLDKIRVHDAMTLCTNGVGHHIELLCLCGDNGSKVSSKAGVNEIYNVECEHT